MIRPIRRVESATGEAGEWRVAFVISDDANVMDLVGAWEVFQDVACGGGAASPFALYTVSDAPGTVRASGGMLLRPHFTIDRAPHADIICVGAQRGSPAMHAWLCERAPGTDLIMSVCTGAFQLGRAGLLDGRRCTTHHMFWDALAGEFPSAEVVRGARFVSDDNVLTAAGLTAGIDAALHVVERLCGRSTAERTAQYMEYHSRTWHGDSEARR